MSLPYALRTAEMNAHKRERTGTRSKAFASISRVQLNVIG